MPRPIPLPNYETVEARQWVADQLGLPYHDDMQDWPWEVSIPEGLEDYIQLYSRASDEQRVVIMEMILNAAAWQPTSSQVHSAWIRLRPLLDQNADLHSSTAQYWCLWNYNEQDLFEHGFSISPYLRAWWIENYPIPVDSSLS
ncbi:hypothetical protein [Hymenobacter pini]|uniref:hypothetical protein n=1 Tax=Hymenobacter pini TaxID=2880879 RepID=UPI001CF2645B|nr:hypothetical protein [Hymenobacter pini]MCA8833243.1 hypothetical protein [Hymenobacter pini]